MDINLIKKIMPYVNIKITDEGITTTQKNQLIAGTTKLLVDVLHKNPETTHVVIEEIPIDNWGVNGRLYSELKNKENEA